jgi:hypothetical protein
MERLSKLLRDDRSTAGFLLCLAFLFLVVAAFHARPVPFGNEFIYLLRLGPYAPLNDWSFAGTANEHWLFNYIFSAPANLVSIEVMGWAGRIVVWLLCLAGLIRLGQNWKVPYWTIAASIAVWLATAQTTINAEWMIATFEAKTVAYACLLFALNDVANKSLRRGAVLLGLSFSFHPAVGLWAIPAVGLSLVIERVAVSDLLKLVGLTFVFSLPGIIPLVSDQMNAQPASYEDWQFIVTKHMPFHFDPFYFSMKGMVVLGLMLVFNIVALHRAETFALRFLRNFQIAIGAFFVLGFVLRIFEMYPLLRFMPMRLFPILTPLFFLFSAFYLIRTLAGWPGRALAAGYVLVIVGMLNPIAEGIGLLREVKASWVRQADDRELTLTWLAENTVPDAVILAAPVGKEFWYHSSRSQPVSYMYPRYDRLGEWRKRIGDLSSNVQVSIHPESIGEIEAAFDGLTYEQIDSLRREYSATHLVTRAEYSYPLLYRSGPYKVYALPEIVPK